MGGTAVTDVPTRALIIALKSPPVGKSSARISELTGVDPRTIDRVYSRAIAAGFEPNVLPLKLLPKHVEDAPRSGRPVKEQTKDTKDQMMQQLWRYRDISNDYLESLERGRKQEDQANEEDWIDTGDEETEAEMGA